jgi:hypothetical protein
MSTEQEKTMIAIESLEPRKGNRSVGLRKESLDGLVASIRERGIINALLVRPIGSESFEIVCGHRRLLAAQVVGLKELPCDVRALTDDEADDIAAIDNLQREDLHPLDEAAIYDSMVRKVLQASAYVDLVGDAAHEKAIELAAARVGKPLTYFRARMKLLALSGNARKAWLADKAGDFTLGHALVLCRYPLSVQDRIISSRQNSFRHMTVADLTAEIARAFHVELSKAPFRMDDAKLVPQAGACLACPKRTGADHLLFPEVGKKDLCLDPKCFQAKAEAEMKRKISELKESGEPYYLVSNEWDGHQKLPAGTLRQHDWTRAEKGEKGEAVKCLVVFGEGKGSIIQGFKRKDSPTGRQAMTPKEKKERAALIQKNKVERQLVTSLLDQTLVALGKIFEKSLVVPEGFTRALAYRVFERLYGGHETKLCKALGWEQSKERVPGMGNYSYSSWKPTVKRELGKMTIPEVHLFVARCLLAESFPPDPQDSEMLRDLAILGGLDPKKIEAQIRAELAKPIDKGPKLVNVSADGKAAAKRKAIAKRKAR